MTAFNTKDQKRVTASRIILVIIIAIALIRLFTLGAYPLMDATESRYAEIARKMAVSGDFITPRFIDGSPFWGKPPLSMWLSALSFRLFGVGEFSARFPAFLLAIGVLVMTGRLALLLYGRAQAYLAVLILSSTVLFFVVSGSVMTDPALGAALTLSLLSLITVIGPKDTANAPGRQDVNPVWGYLFFAGLGLALMAKGPVGIVLTGVPLCIWAFAGGRSREILRSLPWAGGLALIFVISAPWHIMAQLRTPGFLQYYIVGEHWKRFVEPGWRGDLYGHGHAMMHGSIWLLGLGATLPWSFILALALWRLKKRGRGLGELFGRPASLLLVFWALGPFLFFTLTSNILVTYVYPALPAFAVLTAGAVCATGKGLKPVAKRLIIRPAVIYATALFIPVLFLILAFTLLPAQGLKKSHKALATYFLAQDPAPADGLFYYGRVRHSAVFYSGGRARAIEDKDEAYIKALLEDRNHDFFAVKDKYKDEFLLIAGDKVALARVFGRYILYSETAPAGSASR